MSSSPLPAAAHDSAEWIKTLSLEAAKGWIRTYARKHPWLTDALHSKTAIVEECGRFDLGHDAGGRWPVGVYKVTRPELFDRPERTAWVFLFLNEDGEVEVSVWTKPPRADMKWRPPEAAGGSDVHHAT